MFYYRDSLSKKAFETEAVPKQFLTSNVIISLTYIIFTTEYVFWRQCPAGRIEIPGLSSEEVVPPALSHSHALSFSPIWKKIYRKTKKYSKSFFFSLVASTFLEWCLLYFHTHHLGKYFYQGKL